MTDFSIKNTFILFILLILFPLSLLAQKDANALFNSQEYAEAKIAYENLLKQNQNSVLYNYRYARCCYELKENDLSIFHFEKAGSKYPLRNFYIGELYFYAYRFEESIEAYKSYLETLKADDNRIPSIQKSIEKSQLGAKLLNRVEDIAIIDSILVNKNEFLNFYKISKELGKLQNDPIRTKGDTLLDRVMYKTERGDRLFFSDTIESSFNLFTSIKLLDEWSEPKAISSVINTANNENYPFLLLDGVTLYYASDTEGTLGGYDIFMTRFSSNSKSYLQPENIGMPFNSPYNDYMMVLDDLNNTGWFVSDRHQVEGKVVIYHFELNDPKVYFRSDNEDELRQVARLIKYRRAESKEDIKQINQNTVTDPDNNRFKTSDFVLVINDSIYYNQLEQIQSTLALAKVKEWLILNASQKQRELELNKLRTEYVILENQEQTKRLNEDINAIEDLYFETELTMKTKLIEAANEEIKFIQKN